MHIYAGWRQREAKERKGFEDTKHFRRIKAFARFDTQMVSLSEF
jgi:hypothetical protein